MGYNPIPMHAAPPEIWSVGQLTRRIKNLLEGEVGQVWVSGEISNWTRAASGHAYFTLKDKESQIDAVMFKGRLARLRFEPKSGLEVVAFGLVSVYERRGQYQIVLEDMQPKGVGALQLEFEKLKRKLEAEGLFAPEHKKPLPMLPRRIGIVTSPTGAAIRDILHVLDRRFANVHVLLYPARVQGEGAAREIVEGIRALDAYGVDVMIVGRGGGSIEDLWSFNEEAVVRAVFDARTPIISAVGHEIDFALTDFAADLRAPTPSAAAEIVIRERETLLAQLGQLRRRLASGMGRRVERARHRVAVARSCYVFARPEELVRQRRQAADEARMRLESALGARAEHARQRLAQAGRALRFLSPAMRLRQAAERLAALRGRLRTAALQRLPAPKVRLAQTLRRLASGGAGAAARKRAALSNLGAQLDALSPLAILSRGYAAVWKLPERTLVRTSAALSVKDELYVRFGAGAVHARVTGVEKGDHGEVKT